MRTVIIIYSNELMGTGEFWRGSEGDLAQIRNIPARKLAEKAITENQNQQLGMWKVELHQISS